MQECESNGTCNAALHKDQQGFHNKVTVYLRLTFALFVGSLIAPAVRSDKATCVIGYSSSTAFSTYFNTKFCITLAAKNADFFMFFISSSSFNANKRPTANPTSTYDTWMTHASLNCGCLGKFKYCIRILIFIRGCDGPCYSKQIQRLCFSSQIYSWVF